MLHLIDHPVSPSAAGCLHLHLSDSGVGHAEINFKEKSFMDAVKIEGNPLPGKIQVDYDGELLVGQSILLNGKNLTLFSRYKIFDFIF